MKPLATQDEFEMLIGKQEETYDLPDLTVVYFTASWCGACKRLDFPALLSSTPQDIVWYKCDVDENKYTLGYCGLKSIPSFAVIKNGKFLGKFSSSDTMTVFDTLQETFE